MGVDVIDAHFLTLRLAPKFAEFDRTFLTLAVMRALREGGRDQCLLEVEARVAKILDDFGRGSGRKKETGPPADDPGGKVH